MNNYATEHPEQRADMVFRALWNNLVAQFREQAGELTAMATVAAVRPVVKDEEAAKKVGKVVSDGFKISTTVSANVRDFVNVTRDARKSKKELQREVEPFLIGEFGKSSGRKLAKSSNEIIAHQRGRIAGQTKYDIVRATAGLADKTPDLLQLMDKRREALEEQGKEKGAQEEILAGDKVPGLEEAEKKIRQGIDKATHGVDGIVSAGIFDKQHRDLLNVGIRTGVPAVQEYFENEGARRVGKNSAYEMIKLLSKQAENSSGDLTYVRAGDDQIPLEEYILDVFQQHQKDIEGIALNDRYRSMPELKKACEMIAEEIDRNKLDPMALVALVGDRKILDKDLVLAKPDDVRSALRDVWKIMEHSDTPDTEEFINESAFDTKEEFKAILNGLPEEEKPFFVSLFPTSVLKEMGDMKQKDIDALRDKMGDEQFPKEMLGAVEEIAALDEEEIQRLGLTPEEISMLRMVNEAVQENGKDAVLEQMGGDGRDEVKTALVNAKGLWEKRITSERKPEKEQDGREIKDEARDGEDRAQDPFQKNRRQSQSSAGIAR